MFINLPTLFLNQEWWLLDDYKLLLKYKNKAYSHEYSWAEHLRATNKSYSRKHSNSPAMFWHRSCTYCQYSYHGPSMKTWQRWHLVNCQEVLRSGHHHTLGVIILEDMAGDACTSHAWLRIGHIHFTHCHLWHHAELWYKSCMKPLTGHHIFTESEIPWARFLSGGLIKTSLLPSGMTIRWYVFSTVFPKQVDSFHHL